MLKRTRDLSEDYLGIEDDGKAWGCIDKIARKHNIPPEYLKRIPPGRRTSGQKNSPDRMMMTVDSEATMPQWQRRIKEGIDVVGDSLRSVWDRQPSDRKSGRTPQGPTVPGGLKLPKLPQPLGIP